MKEITIRKSPSADTRSADHIVSKEELYKSTIMHISDVEKAMTWFASKIKIVGKNHDWTKIHCFDDFYKQFSRAQETGKWGSGWYNDIHTAVERHHLKERCPDNVDLIDVLEQIADGVMAGLARNGEYRQEDIPDELLRKAYENTVKKLLDATEVK